MEDQVEMDALRQSRIRHRTNSGPRPSSSPPDPPDALPLGSSVKKVNIFKGMMSGLKTPAIETYSSDLNQSKPPAGGDLIWLRPSRISHRSMELTGISQNSTWILVTLTRKDEEESIDSSTWFFTLEGMKKVAKVNLRKSEAWEHLSDMTSYEADQARRDRMANLEHPHNLIENPKITVSDEEVNPAATQPKIITPSNRVNAKKAVTKQWNQEHPNRHRPTHPD